MHVLLLGGTGNLGLRVIPALLAHGHTVVAYIRSEAKLRSLITPALFDAITIHIGDALDTSAVEAALRQHGCDGIMDTAGNATWPWREQYIGKITTAVTQAAIRVGKDRGKRLRVWRIGGLTSLVCPGTGGKKVEELLPAGAPMHHRDTEVAIKQVSLDDVEWTLLCVAWMRPESSTIDLLPAPHGNNLVLQVDTLPLWEGTRIGVVPWLGGAVDLFWNMSTYTTQLEDVADLVAENMAKEEGAYAGQIIGMIDRKKLKTA